MVKEDIIFNEWVCISHENNTKVGTGLTAAFSLKSSTGVTLCIELVAL